MKQEREMEKSPAVERRLSSSRLGSRFEDFLASEGILEEAQAVAAKRVLAFQISEAMDEQGLTKSAMAQRMKTSRASLDRLLDPKHPSVTLLTLEKAARALGKQLWVEIA